MLFTEDRYINPQTDFGFKRLFGSEFNKELLISFLNALFRGEQDVKDRRDAKCVSRVFQRPNHLLFYIPHTRTGAAWK